MLEMYRNIIYSHSNYQFKNIISLLFKHLKYIIFIGYPLWFFLCILIQFLIKHISLNDNIVNIFIIVSLAWVFASIIADLPKKNIREYIINSKYNIHIKLKLIILCESFYLILFWTIIILIYLPNLLVQPFLYGLEGAVFLLNYILGCIFFLFLGIIINLIDLNLFISNFITSFITKLLIFIFSIFVFYVNKDKVFLFIERILINILEFGWNNLLLNQLTKIKFNLYTFTFPLKSVVFVLLSIVIILYSLLLIIKHNITRYSNKQITVSNNFNKGLMFYFFLNSKRRINYINLVYIVIIIGILIGNYIFYSLFNLTLYSELVYIISVLLLYNFVSFSNKSDLFFLIKPIFKMGPSLLMVLTSLIFDYLFIIIILSVFDIGFLSIEGIIYGLLNLSITSYFIIYLTKNLRKYFSQNLIEVYFKIIISLITVVFVFILNYF